jgi:hypothetical protein
MSYRFLPFLVGVAIAAALASQLAQAASPRDSQFAGDKYGYSFRVDARDVYSDGARGRFDVYTDGARDVTPPSRDQDSSRYLSGMDRRGVSAEPSRQFDVYTDGALA